MMKFRFIVKYLAALMCACTFSLSASAQELVTVPVHHMGKLTMALLIMVLVATGVLAVRRKG